MSIQSQEKNMTRLAELLSRDLSYIYGEKEGGPNGAKRECLLKGRAFLRALAKDLGFRESNVSSNAAGIACSGEIYLYGMWGDNNGLLVMLEQMTGMGACVLYRTITDIKDRARGGSNHFISLRKFSSCGYEALCARLRDMNREVMAHERAA